MNLFRFAAPLLGLLLVTGITSCTSPREKRIANNPALYNKLSDNDKFLVGQGRIREGMTREGVFLSWGRADRVSEGRQKGKTLERWTYFDTYPVYNQTYGVGLGWGRFGYGYGGFGGLGYGYGGLWDPYWAGIGPSISYIPYKAATVDFQGGRVTDYVRESTGLVE